MRRNIRMFGTIVLCWGIIVFGIPPAESAPVKIGPTKEKPITVDMKERSVSVLAQVNGKYFYQATRHGVVFSGGANGEKSLFRSYATPQDFYDGLLKLGYKPGNNMSRENAEKTLVQGDLLEVTVTWNDAGKEYGLDEVITDSNKKPLLIRFGGNLQNSLQYKTGCLLCLDSCPVGITSNASYTMGAVEKRSEVIFKGNSKALPPDGSLVVIKIRAKGRQ